MAESGEVSALSREQAIDLLRGGEAGVAEWNRVRTRGCDVPSLAEVDLRNTALCEANLEGVDLTRANLEGADLFEANLEGADLSEANLEGAHLSDASLSDATLIEACLTSANLMGAVLSKARLSYADLSRATLIGAELTAANLNRANFMGAKLVGAHLALAKLSGTSFREADMRGAELSEAELSEADLGDTDLRKTDLGRALLDSTELTGARFDDACLDAAVFTNVTLGPDHDLLVARWEHLGLNGTSYARQAVERGSQRLPRGRAPLRFRFRVWDALTRSELGALTELVKLEGERRNTRLSVELTAHGEVLCVESRGELTRASLVGALLFALPIVLDDERASAEYGQVGHGDDASASATLRAAIARSFSAELGSCTKKLGPPTVQLRSEAERRIFEATFRESECVLDLEIFENEISLKRRSPASERAFLQALGFTDYLPATIIAPGASVARSKSALG